MESAPVIRPAHLHRFQLSEQLLAVRQNVLAIMNNEKIRMETLYSTVYHLVLDNHTEQVLAELRAALSTYFSGTCSKISKLEGGKTNSVTIDTLTVPYIDALLAEWRDVRGKIEVLVKPFAMLECTYGRTPSNQGVAGIVTLLFKEKVLLSPAVNERFWNEITKLASIYREAYFVRATADSRATPVYQSLTRKFSDISTMIHETQYDSFWTKFRSASYAFYHQLSRKLSKMLLSPEYLGMVENFLNLETDWLEEFVTRNKDNNNNSNSFPDNGEHRYLGAVAGVLREYQLMMRKEFISPLIESLLEQPVFLESFELEGLKRVMGMFPEAQDPLIGVINEHVRTEGVKAAEGCSPKTALPVVLKWTEIWERYKKVINVCFDGNPKFLIGLTSTFRRVFDECQKKGYNIAELLTYFMDQLLRQWYQQHHTGDNNNEHTDNNSNDNNNNNAGERQPPFMSSIASGAELANLIVEKDLLERYYKFVLAKRLLVDGGRDTVNDVERTALGLVKSACGGSFALRPEMMFREIERSMELNAEFKKFIKNNNNWHELCSIKTSPDGHPTKVLHGIDFYAVVLSGNLWGNVPALRVEVEVPLPPVVIDCRSAFSAFFRNENPYKKLTWLTGEGVVKMNGRCELTVSECQMGILMMFNSHPQLSLMQLKQIIQPKDSEALVIQLATLVNYNVLVINKASPSAAPIASAFPNTTTETNSSSKAISARKQLAAAMQDDDTFSVNLSLKVRRINLTKVRNVKEVKQQVHHKLEEERKDQIDAAIVRIAKQHRTIDWIALVSSVTEALSSRFAPNSAVIKSRIEDLIQREYLMRDEDNKRIIHYCP